MELKNLKSGWQNAGMTLKTSSDLEKMTHITRHPSLKRIRVKLIIEIISLGFFLVVYYDWFDGDRKPFIANVLLAVSLALYILNDVIGYISLIKPVKKESLKFSIQKYFISVKRLAIISVLISILFAVSLLGFFVSVIDFTKEKKLILAGIAFTLFQLIHLSVRTWNRRIKQLAQQVDDFIEDDKM